MAPSLTTFAMLSLAATSLAAPTTLEARKSPAITFIDQAIESVAGKACGLWSIIHHETKPVVKPSCEQWVADATQILPFRMVTGVYEGKCKSWNVRVTSNNVATPECGDGHRHGGKDAEDVLDGDKDHRAGADVKEEEDDDDKKPNAWQKKQDEERKKKEKEEDENDKAAEEQEKKDKKKEEERIKEEKEKEKEKEKKKDKDGNDGNDGKEKRQIITMEQDGKRVAIPDLWSNVEQ